MAKRPQISDDLHELVHTIHKEYTQEQASGFESALKTVTQLAEAQILEKEDTDPGWYPGKYMSEVVNRLSNENSTTDRGSSGLSTGGSNSTFRGSVDPDTQAVFKTRLGSDGEIIIPEVEIEALDLSDEQLLQVIAYAVADD
jgi:hypothetical protein